MEIKNCSIYPRYEESLPKMSRIPEFALFMYHRHGKSNRVKCLPHSNGQALSATVLPAGAQTPPAPASAGPVDPALIEDLVAGSRILADQGVLDAFGHISVRHPKDPNRFLMSRSLAPALVTANDIMEFDLDANPVDPQGRALFLERFIHAQI